MNSFASFASLVARSLRRWGLMPVRSSVELAYKLAVVITRQTTIVFDLRRVVDVVNDRCLMDDRVDRCSS